MFLNPETLLLWNCLYSSRTQIRTNCYSKYYVVRFRCGSLTRGRLVERTQYVTLPILRRRRAEASGKARRRSDFWVSAGGDPVLRAPARSLQSHTTPHRPGSQPPRSSALLTFYIYTTPHPLLHTYCTTTTIVCCGFNL